MADGVSDVFETAGNILNDASNAAGRWAEGQLPTAGRALRIGLAWIGEVSASVMTAAAAALKAALSTIGYGVAGAIVILAGIVSARGRMALAGATEIVASVTGGALVTIGSALHVLNAFFLGTRTRRLTKGEREIAGRVFGKSLACYNIRIALGRGGLFRLGYALAGYEHARPFVLGNTIYFLGGSVDSGVLIHECTHVWQYQHRGPGYAAKALGAQFILGNAAYDWMRELQQGRTRWEEMNYEAQAQLVQDAWCGGDPAVNHASPADDAIATIRGARTARVSSLHDSPVGARHRRV